MVLYLNTKVNLKVDDLETHIQCLPFEVTTQVHVNIIKR